MFSMLGDVKRSGGLRQIADVDTKIALFSIEYSDIWILSATFSFFCIIIAISISSYAVYW